MMGQHMRPGVGALGQPGDFLHHPRDAVESDLLPAFIFLDMDQDIRADEQRASVRAGRPACAPGSGPSKDSIADMQW